MPKVTVCIPTYNRSDYLQYAVGSVLAQTFSDFELIICDDGSRDDTPEIAKNWQELDSRVRYVRHEKNIGRSRNMRSGFDAATGEYFIKFDDDDALTPEFLAQTVRILDAHKEVDFVCSDHWIINAKSERDEVATDANSEKWGKNRLAEGLIADLERETFLHQSLQVGSTLFRRSCLTAVDYMRAEADGCEDYDLLVRLALAGYQGYFLPQRLMEYRFHGAQTSLKQDIHFLSAKVYCIESYQFKDPNLEAARRQKLAITQQVLGLRLIEKGESARGRELLNQSTQVLGKSKKVSLGLMLSYLPVSLRQIALKKFRQFRPKDYSEKVREAAR